MQIRPTRFQRTGLIVAASAAWLLGTPMSAASQQAMPAYGRVSIHFSGGGVSERAVEGEAAGEDVRFGEIVTSFAWRSHEPVEGGTEFAIEGRGATYPGTSRESRLALYDGYVGYRAAQGKLGVRAGQMWITDLGGLGAVTGMLVEARRRGSEQGAGIWRFGGFGGLEPSPAEIEYASGVRKAGGYVAFDGVGARRHVIGYVQVRNNEVIERSVVTSLNFLPIGKKLFVYQAGEYDLSGVGGNGEGRLTYWLTNARVTASSRVDLQLNYHRGRSIDTRSLALDVLQGAPVSTQRVQGLLYESIGGRARVAVLSRVRLSAGYSRDRTNQIDLYNHRYFVGGHAWNLAGFDVTITRSAVSGGRTYTAWDGSVGRPVGSRLYLTGDYSTDVSSVRLAETGGGFTIEHRPRTRRLGASGLVNLTRRYSLLLSAERSDDGAFVEHREMAGLTVRF